LLLLSEPVFSFLLLSEPVFSFLLLSEPVLSLLLSEPVEDSQTNVISTNDNGLSEPQDSSLEGSNECIWNEAVKKSNVSYQKSSLPCNEEKLTDLHVNIKKHGDVNGSKKEKTGSDSNKERDCLMSHVLLKADQSSSVNLSLKFSLISFCSL
jgi:hypothetical protein